MKPRRLALALTLLCPAVLGAQTTRLRLTGFNGNLGNVTLQNFIDGSIVSATGIIYTVDQRGTDTTARTTTIYVRASAATMAGGKSASDCSWRRDDLSTWTPLSTTDAAVESQPIKSKGQTWSNTLWLQCSLNWATDPPATNSVDVIITLQVTP